MKFIFLVFCLSFLPYACFTQNFTNQVSSDQNWLISTFNSSNGLSQNSVDNIIKDKNGMFWMTTQDGVFRFDGQRVKIFNANTFMNPDMNRVSSIAFLNDTLVIIGEGDTIPPLSYITNSVVHTSQKFNQYLYNNFNICKNKCFPKQSQSILEDIFIFHTPNAVNIDIKKQVTPHRFDSNLPNSTFIFEESNHYIYHHKKDGCIDIFDNNEVKINEIKLPKKTFLAHLAYQKRFLVFFKNDTYVSYYRGKKENVGSIYFPERNFKDYTLISSCNMEEDLFLYVNNSLFLLELDEKQNFKPTLLVKNIEFGKINNIYFDKPNNTLIVGTVLKGLWILKKRPFRVLKEPTSSNNSYNSVLEISDNNVIATNNMEHVISTSIQDFSVNKIYDFNKKHKRATSLWKDRMGRIWAYCIDKITNHCEIGYFKNPKLKSFQPVIPIELPYKLSCYPKNVQTRDNRIWIITNSGIFVFTNDSVRLILPLKLDAAIIYSIVCDHSNNLWIATSAGLYKYDTKLNAISNINIFGKFVRAIKIEKDSSMWVGTYGDGFYYYEKGKVYKPKLDQHNFLRNVHAFKEDDKGCIWITTNQGLFRFKKDTFVKGIKSSTALENYYYETLYGQPSDEFNGGDASPLISTQNGTFVGANLAGLVLFKPSNMPIIYPTSQVILDKFSLNNKDTILNNGVILSHNFGQLAIEMAQSFWGHPYNQKVEYQLEGLNNIWYPYSMGEKLTINNLSMGKYALHVRYIKNIDGAYEYQKLLDFQVATPWYFTKIAFLFYVILLTALFIILKNIQNRKMVAENKKLEALVKEKTLVLEKTVEELEKANKIKRRLLTIIAHDIKTPLVFISNIGKNAKNYDKDKLLHFAESVSTTTRELVKWVTNIFHWINTSENSESYTFQSIDISIIIEEIFFVYDPIIKQKNIEIKNTIRKPSFVFGDVHWIRILFNNILENSIKFTINGLIEIKTHSDDKQTYIVFKDTGTGIEEEELKLIQSGNFINSSKGTLGENGLGLGFAIIYDIVKKHKGSITIESTLHKGTNITIGFPNPEI